MLLPIILLNSGSGSPWDYISGAYIKITLIGRLPMYFWSNSFVFGRKEGSRPFVGCHAITRRDQQRLLKREMILRALAVSSNYASQVLGRKEGIAFYYSSANGNSKVTRRTKAVRLQATNNRDLACSTKREVIL